MSSNERKRRISRRDAWLTGIVLVLIIGAVLALKQLPGSNQVAVSFGNSDGRSTASFYLDVADDAGERTKGVMYLKPGDIKENGGMIFVYPDEVGRGHWMRNTYISLDMLFVNKDRRVVGIISDVPILNDEPRRVETPSTYVVELLAGMARKHDIRVGDELKFSGAPLRAHS